MQGVRFSATQQRLAEQSRDTYTFFFFFPWCAYTVWPPARLSSDGRSSHRQLTAVTQRHVQHERGRERSSARTCYLFFNVVLHSIKNSASKSKDGVEFPPSLAK